MINNEVECEALLAGLGITKADSSAKLASFGEVHMMSLVTVEVLTATSID